MGKKYLSSKKATTSSNVTDTNYERETDRIKPLSGARYVANNNSTYSAIDSTVSKLKTADTGYSYLKQPINVQTLIAKLTGVGHMVLPKDIKFQKWLISTLLAALFMFSSIANGVIINGIETVINDTCYSPFSKITKEPNSAAYRCPSFAGGFVKNNQKIYIRLFEIGSTIHTISIGIASSAIYYLNFNLIVIYIVLFLLGLTLMLASAFVEIFYMKVGLLLYFNLSAQAIGGFLMFFAIDVIHLFAAINLQVRWINYLSS